jgi:hypothetical protein
MGFHLEIEVYMAGNKKKGNTLATAAFPAAPITETSKPDAAPKRTKVRVHVGRQSRAAKQLEETERKFEKAFPITEGTLDKLIEKALSDLHEGRTVDLDPTNVHVIHAECPR